MKSVQRGNLKRALLGVSILASVMVSARALAETSKEVKGTGFVAVPEEAEKANSPESQAPLSPVSTNAVSQPAAANQVSPPAEISQPVVVPVARHSAAEIPSYDGLTQENAMHKAWMDELDAIKKKEELELEAARVRDEHERKEADFNVNMSQKKRKIYQYRQKQDEYADEIDRMKAEIVELDGREKEMQKDLVAAEQHAKVHESKFSDVKSDLDDTKSQLAASLERLHKTREQTARKVNEYMIQMQQMRAENATIEAEIARADNDRSRAEAEELQTRGQWSALTARTQALRQDKNRMMAELNDMKARLESARQDYQKIKNETEQSQAEKTKAEVEVAREKSNINSEMRKLEQDSSYAYNQKANNEAEKVRLSAEIEKLRTDLAFVKKRNADAHEEGSEADGAVMESRLAFETAKADLSKELSTAEVSAMKHDEKAVTLRGLASVAEQSDMMDAHKPWIATKSCAVTRTPASTGEVGGKVSSGERLIAAPSGGGYVKILNSSGRPAYLPMACGHFTE